MFLPTAQNRYPSNLNQLDIAAVLSPHSNDEVLSGGKVKRKIVKSSQNAICFFKEIPAVLELGWIYIQLLENLRVPVSFHILVFSPNKQIYVQKKIQNPNILTWLIRKEHTLVSDPFGSLAIWCSQSPLSVHFEQMMILMMMIRSDKKRPSVFFAATALRRGRYVPS